MKSTRLALIALALLLLSSCLPSREASLNLAPTPPLSGGPGWAVVKGAYVRLKPGPSQGGADISHLRQGEVLEVTGRDLGAPSVPADKGVWYRLKGEGMEGWAREADLDVFASQAQAERAAQGYR